MKVKVEREDRYKITLPSGKVLHDFKKESEWEGMVKFKGVGGILILSSNNSLLHNLGMMGIKTGVETGWSVVSGSPSLIMENPKEKVVSVLRDLISYAESSVCLHEETHRGGAIWEICDFCGAKWADDEGGKPADVSDLPRQIEAAYSLLSEIDPD